MNAAAVVVGVTVAAALAGGCRPRQVFVGDPLEYVGGLDQHRAGLVAATGVLVDDAQPVVGVRQVITDFGIPREFQRECHLELRRSSDCPLRVLDALHR
jgi:hypothetical protein